MDTAIFVPMSAFGVVGWIATTTSSNIRRTKVARAAAELLAVFAAATV